MPWHGSAEQRQRRRHAKELPLTQAWRVCLGDRRDVRTAAVDITTEWMPRLDRRRSVGAAVYAVEWALKARAREAPPSDPELSGGREREWW